MARIESSQLPLVNLSALDGVTYSDIEPILSGQFDAEIFPGGTRSIGAKVRLTDEDLFYFKIYYKTPIPRSTLTEFIQRSKKNFQFSFEQALYLQEPVSETEIYHMLLMRQVEQQAAAHVVGSRITPDFITPLHAIWVYQTVPVGYTIEFIKGKPITTKRALELGGENLQKALQELRENGVSLDSGLNHYNVIKTPSRKIKLIDLDYEFPRI